MASSSDFGAVGFEELEGQEQGQGQDWGGAGEVPGVQNIMRNLLSGSCNFKVGPCREQRHAVGKWVGVQG